MSYYFATTLKVPFDAAIARVTAALKERGFGVFDHHRRQGDYEAKA